MLPLPESDYTRSQVIASWLELAALADDDGAAYRGDALESMRDSQLFADSSAADDRKEGDSSDPHSAAGNLAQAWAVLRSRERDLGSNWPFCLSDDALTRRPGRKQLDQVCAYAAMLLIEAASLKWYLGLAIKAGDPIRHWFEEIAVACMRRFSNGVTVRFGAPFPSSWPPSFKERVKHLANLFELDARDSEIVRYSSTAQQDDSLDIVTRLRVSDELEGVPYLLVQCATGANWSTHKPAQPTIELWDKYISWNGPRLKALAVPFSLREKGELASASVRHLDALVLDRQRLAGALPDDLIEDGLRQNLTQWCKAKFDTFRKPPAALAVPAPPIKRKNNSSPRSRVSK